MFVKAIRKVVNIAIENHTIEVFDESLSHFIERIIMEWEQPESFFSGYLLFFIDPFSVELFILDHDGEPFILGLILGCLDDLSF